MPVLHSTHMVLAEGFLLGKNIKIKRSDLASKSIVERETKSIEGYRMFDNIFVTTKPGALGFTCKVPEFLFHNGNKHNYTKKVVWLSKEETIYSAKGIISEANALELYKTSKDNLEQISLESIDELDTPRENNDTMIFQFIQSFNDLEVGQKAGISLGIIGALLLLFVIVVLGVGCC